MVEARLFSQTGIYVPAKRTPSPMWAWGFHDAAAIFTSTAFRGPPRPTSLRQTATAFLQVDFSRAVQKGSRHIRIRHHDPKLVEQQCLVSTDDLPICVVEPDGDVLFRLLLFHLYLQGLDPDKKTAPKTKPRHRLRVFALRRILRGPASVNGSSSQQGHDTDEHHQIGPAEGWTPRSCKPL